MQHSLSYILSGGVGDHALTWKVRTRCDIYIYIYVYIFIFIHKYIHIYVYMQVCMHVCTYSYIDIGRCNAHVYLHQRGAKVFSVFIICLSNSHGANRVGEFIPR